MSSSSSGKSILHDLNDAGKLQPDVTYKVTATSDLSIVKHFNVLFHKSAFGEFLKIPADTRSRMLDVLGKGIWTGRSQSSIGSRRLLINKDISQVVYEFATSLNYAVPRFWGCWDFVNQTLHLIQIRIGTFSHQRAYSAELQCQDIVNLNNRAP